MLYAQTRKFGKLLFQAVLRHNVVDLGAQLAYWSLLALFPFVIFLLTAIGYLSVNGLDEQLMTWIAPFMPPSALTLVWQTVHEVVGQQRGGLLAISLVGALWSAASGVSAMQVSLNRAYNVHETRPYWRRKSEAMLFTLAGTVLLGLAVVGATVGPELLRLVLDLLGVASSYSGFGHVWAWIRYPLSLASLVGLLLVTYTFLPSVRHGWDLGSYGSVAAVLGWLLTTWLFKAFVGIFHTYARSYGALGAVVILMTWIYLTGIAVIMGAEINAVLARMRYEDSEGEPST